MTTPRSEVPAAPRHFRDTELDRDAVFTKELRMIVDAGGAAPTEALGFRRDVRRWVYYALGLPGGAITLVKGVEGAVVEVARYRGRLAAIERNGATPEPALLASMERAKNLHSRLVADLEKLPAVAKRDVAGELRELLRGRERMEREMERFRPGSADFEAYVPVHRKLLDRQLELEKLVDHAATIRYDVDQKIRAATEAARGALATSLAHYVATILVKRRDELLADQSDIYRIYWKAIPDAIERLWREAVRVGEVAAGLRGHPKDAEAVQWKFFNGLDPELDLAVQQKLRLIRVGQHMQPTPVAQKPPTEAQVDEQIRSALPE